MHCRDGDCGVHGLGEGVLEEAQVCPLEYASVVWVELDVNDLLVMGSSDTDCGGEPYVDWCLDGGQHWVCLRVSQGDDKIDEL